MNDYKTEEHGPYTHNPKTEEIETSKEITYFCGCIVHLTGWDKATSASFSCDKHHEPIEKITETITFRKLSPIKSTGTIKENQMCPGCNNRRNLWECDRCSEHACQDCLDNDVHTCDPDSVPDYLL